MLFLISPKTFLRFELATHCTGFTHPDPQAMAAPYGFVILICHIFAELIDEV